MTGVPNQCTRVADRALTEIEVTWLRPGDWCRSARSGSYARDFNVLRHHDRTIFSGQSTPHRPHIHAKFQGEEAVISIPDGELLEGHLPPGKMKMVLAWVEIHREDLMADWELAVIGQQRFRIEPLR